MKRIYEQLISEHFNEYRQMVFLSGPRQVGKTTSSRAAAGIKGINKYMNWDNQVDRRLITRGPDAAAEHLGLSDLSTDPPHIVFDEIHKYRKWKSFLKGFFDIYGDRCHSVVTGSARLNVFRRGGDSLMGRYFLYRMHPLSVAELLKPEISKEKISLPQKIDKESFQQLLAFGGFPEPFLKNNARFYNKWKRLRNEQFFYEDIRDITNIYETGQIRVFAELIKAGVGTLFNYSWYASNTNVSVDTIRRWLGLLEMLYYCFIVRPWFRNIPKSLRKQPKVYLWDWSIIEDPGARMENFIASHLLKAIHYWTDNGFGDYELYFLRDKAKREVDFLVTQNGSPWFLVEVKSSYKRSLNPNFEYFHELLKTHHAFQVALDLDYVERDCFSVSHPVRVPAETFLSQLI